MKKLLVYFLVCNLFYCSSSVNFDSKDVISKLQGQWYAEKQSIVSWSQKIDFTDNMFYLEFDKAVDLLSPDYPPNWTEFSKGGFMVDQKYIVFQGVHTDSLFQDTLKVKIHPKQEIGSYSKKYHYDFHGDTLRIGVFPEDTDLDRAWKFVKK